MLTDRTTAGDAAEVFAMVDAAFADARKPAHFTDYRHCSECAEHDETLRNRDRDSLQISDVNNPGWDPLCFCTPEGKAYYMPTLIRFALTPSESGVDAYWPQLLFHLESNGPNNDLIRFCTPVQRHAIARFLEYLIKTRPGEIESFNYSDEILRTHGYWAEPA